MYPSFSSDKSQIAWRRALSIPGTNDQNYEIFVKDLVTGEERNISNSDSYDSNPHWSPKGDWIVYSSNEGGSSNLFLSKPDGSRKIKITQAEGRSIAFGIPTFSFDGTKVIANRYIQDVTDIVIIDISAIR
jgi:TolB protein